MIKKTLSALLILFCLALLFAPQIISNYIGKWAIERYANSKGGSLSVQNISLNWLGPQEFQGIRLTLKDGSWINADKIEVNASILSAITNPIPLVELDASNLSASFLEGKLQLQNMNFIGTAENENIRLNLNGLTTSDNQKGQFLIEALVNPSTQQVLEASGTIDNLPIALIDQFMGVRQASSSSLMTAIFGPTANLQLQKRDNIVLAVVDTSTLKGKFSISLPEEGFEIHNTAPLTFQVSPALFHLLRNDLTPETIKRLEVFDFYTFTEVQFVANLAHKRFAGSIKGDLEGFPVTARVSNSLISLSSFAVERGDVVSLEVEVAPEPFNKLREALYGPGSGAYLVLDKTTKMILNLQKLNLETKEFTGDLIVEPLVAKNAQTGQLINFPQLNGQINMINGGSYSLQMHAGNSDVIATYKGASNLKLRATLNRFFYGIFSDLITGDPMIRERAEATLGNDLSGEITISIDSGEGYLNGSLKGTNGSIDLSSGISGGNVYLRTPFILQTQMSPQLAQTVLGSLLPFLSSGLESDQTIVLRIEPDNFSVPLSSPHLTNINIGAGSLQLGRMKFHNDGAIESMLSILKPAPSGQISVWFTPAYFSIQNGVLTLQRLDMLAMQAYHLAVWGRLDFKKEYVDMKLGLAGTALNKAFNMPSPLTSDDMVAFPLRGPFGNASVDKTKAATQIAGLIAKLQGTPQGFIIGTFIQAAGSLGDEPIPSPTTNPLPWKSEVRPENESAPTNVPEKIEKELKKAAKKPAKMIMRALGF